MVARGDGDGIGIDGTKTCAIVASMSEARWRGACYGREGTVGGFGAIGGEGEGRGGGQRVTGSERHKALRRGAVGGRRVAAVCTRPNRRGLCAVAASIVGNIHCTEFGACIVVEVVLGAFLALLEALHRRGLRKRRNALATSERRNSRSAVFQRPTLVGNAAKVTPYEHSHRAPSKGRRGGGATTGRQV